LITALVAAALAEVLSSFSIQGVLFPCDTLVCGLTS
jgi:hypothetical protein